MSFIALMFEGLKKSIKLYSLKKKFSDSNIQSPYINKHAAIGKNCAIFRDVEIGQSVQIGDYTYINNGSVIISGKIGKFCSIGYYCQIGVYEHPIRFISTSPYTYGERNVFHIPKIWDDIASPPVIGNDVWIGSHSVILQGVTIGDGAIIAAGAVVSKDVPPYTIVGGVPAKEIKKRFNDSEIEYLQKLKWWNLSENEMKKMKELIEKKEDWINHIKDRHNV